MVPDLRGIDEVELRSLFDELLYLPEIDTSLQLRLGILTPMMDSAIRSIQEDDVDVLDQVFDKVVAEVDSPSRRIELAQAVVTLRDQGRIPADLAATAVLELDRKESTFFLSSVAESLAVLAGDRSTPTGTPSGHAIAPQPIDDQGSDSTTYWRGAQARWAISG